MQWRSVLKFIDYDWDTCTQWQAYWKQRDPQKDSEDAHKRSFYQREIDKTFDLLAIMQDKNRTQFVERAKYEANLASLHNLESPLDKVKCACYLAFLLMVPISSQTALIAYTAGIFVNLLTVRKRQLTFV